MPVTVAQLGSRVLRRLGFALVPQSARAAAGSTSSADDIAALVLRDRGVPVAEPDRPAQLPPITQQQAAARVLRQLGVGQATSETTGTVVEDDIATGALRLLGVNPLDTFTAPSTTTTTGVDLAQRALVKLGVYAPDETPLGQDMETAEHGATSVHDNLAIKGLVNWTVDTVPNYAEEIYIALIGNVIAANFGKQGSPELQEAGEGLLRRQALEGQTAQDRAATQVEFVHADLAASGLITWTLASIPAAVGEHYTTMVAQMIAPVFGKARDPEAYQAAETHVKRVALAGSLGQQIAMERIASVHDALNVLGLVSWPVSAIPAAYVEDYAVMAATQLAAFAGLSRDANSRQADMAAWDAAVGHVRKGAMIVGMQARAFAKVQAVHEEMLAMGFVSWTLDDIPASMSDAYSQAATALMGEEGGAVDGKAVEAAYSRIRMVAMNGPAGQALAEQKVRAVHFDLQARGKAQWTLLNIPRYAEEPYVWKAAAMLAPEIGMQPDVAGSLAAERTLLQITAVPTNGRPVQAVYF